MLCNAVLVWGARKPCGELYEENTWMRAWDSTGKAANAMVIPGSTLRSTLLHRLCMVSLLLCSHTPCRVVVLDIHTYTSCM